MSEREQRTERPTPQRREEARREGRAARSRDLTVAVSLLAGFLTLEGWGSPLAEQILQFTRDSLGQLSDAPRFVDSGGLVGIGRAVVLLLAYCSLPIALASCAVVVLGHVAQGACVFVPHTLAPHLGRLHPLEGTRRLASPESVSRGLFASLKLAVVGVLLARMVGEWLAVDGRAATLAASWKVFWESLVAFGVRLSFSLVLLAALDYGVQRWLHERSLRMTRDEIREEAQLQEGDQSIKDRRRRLLAASGRPGADRPGS